METIVIILPLIAGGVTLIAVVGLSLIARWYALHNVTSETTVPAIARGTIDPWAFTDQQRGLIALLPKSLRRTFTVAGFATPNAQVKFVAIHALILVIAVTCCSWLAMSFNSSSTAIFLAGCMGAVIGWWIPFSWLEWRVTKRRIEIGSEFPVMLDLLQISLQGGMSLPTAWETVAKTLESASDAIAQEMRWINLEVGFGVRWGESLMAATERTGVTQFRSLGSLLEQTERFGTGMSLMIQVLCESMRYEEIQVLEERAHQASVKLMIPLVVLMLPATILLILGPMVLMMLDVFKRTTAD
ncbi:MAG: type II secretion system F family protein [Phycisphaerales bacterium]|nr:type II secretion system F family protein [Phycisphaerales bacterium]